MLTPHTICSQRRLDKAAGLIDARHHREDEKPARDEHRARERAPGRRDSNASAMATSDAESEEGVTPEVARRVAEATGWTVHTEPRRGETKGSRPALEIDELMSDTTAVVGSRSTTVPRSRRSSLSTVARLADLDSPTGRYVSTLSSWRRLLTHPHLQTRLHRTLHRVLILHDIRTHGRAHYRQPGAVPERCHASREA